jgi:putative acetyltransferase
LNNNDKNTDIMTIKKFGSIVPVTQNRFAELILIWEASVRATHDFLPEASIDELRPLILSTYLPALAVYAYEDEEGNLLGFAGVAACKLEMLFIAPNSRGQGIGKQLVEYVISQLGVNTVDVNEQNPQAVDFYVHIGFEVVGRSELDGQGNPFPLLHMRYV